MIIRKATLNDDLNMIAKLLYQTDAYIYPYWFENYHDWERVLVDLIKTKGSLYNYENILVCEQDNDICAILVYISKKSNLTFTYSNLKTINENFKFTIENYILPTSSNLENDIIYITNIFTKQEYRRKGLASNLINYIKTTFPNCVLELDVLDENIPALNLYKKQLFEIVKAKPGFNHPDKTKPLVYTMQYKP